MAADAAAAVVAAEAAVAKARLLLVAPRDSYRIAPYIAAARKLDIDLVIASEGRQDLSGSTLPGIQINFQDPRASLQAILNANRVTTFTGILGTDDISMELAVQASMQLQLPHNPLQAVRLARRKDLARQHLARTAVPVPRHWLVNVTAPLPDQLTTVVYPCVVKPVALSASRGVIRADNRAQLEQAIARVARMLSDVPERMERELLLIEEFIHGQEVAVEGMLRKGNLSLLAIFDKPDPLNGPYFEETYYTTPSRHPPEVQAQIVVQVSEACKAYGLCEGPVHAECRINSAGVWILEVAARTIGGLCGRLLRFGTGNGLEELVMLHALGRDTDMRRETGGAGVLMIPVPQAGLLRRVEGIMAAQEIQYVDEVLIDVREGYELVRLPEGNSYLGFIFAHAPTPAEAEAALRAAHACLRIVVAPLWKSCVIQAAAS